MIATHVSKVLVRPTQADAVAVIIITTLSVVHKQLSSGALILDKTFQLSPNLPYLLVFAVWHFWYWWFFNMDLPWQNCSCVSKIIKPLVNLPLGFCR